MAFCPKCGKEVAADAKFCNECGAQLSAEQASETPKTEASSAGATFEAPAGAAATEQVKAVLNTPDVTAQFDAQDIEANKLVAALSYLGLLVLIPILAAPNSRYARFHSNQGLVLLIASMLVGVIGVIPILGWILAAVGGIATFVLMILGIVNAIGGRAKELPIIGKFRILN